MPIADAGVPEEPFRTYRRLRWGQHVELFLLDGRQYRDADAGPLCEDNPDPYGVVLDLFVDAACVEELKSPRTMLGAEQLAWLKAGLIESDATVKFVVPNVPFSFVGLLPYDRWDGYDAERKEILEFIQANHIEGVWLVTTDLHLNIFNPDVNSFFRRFRPDMALSAGLAVPEVIAGPIGMATFRQEAIEGAIGLLGLEGVFGIRAGLNVLFESVMLTLRRSNGWSFLEPDRFAYALIEVSEAGRVDVTFRGIASVPGSPEQEQLETLFTTRPGNMLCGAIGPMSVMLMLLPLGLAGPWRRRRFCV